MKPIMKTIQNSLPRFAALTAVVLVLSLVLTGCKYEDGPVISFRSKRARLEGAKRIVKYTENGVDKTSILLACYSATNCNTNGFNVSYSSSDDYYAFYCDGAMEGILAFGDQSYTGANLILSRTASCLAEFPELGWEVTQLSYEKLDMRNSDSGNAYEISLESMWH